MANIKSSKLDVKKSLERRLSNQRYRGLMKGGIRRAKTAIEAGSDQAVEAVSQAFSGIDRAAARGAIHRNSAARRKSRLARRIVAAK